MDRFKKHSELYSLCKREDNSSSIAKSCRFHLIVFDLILLGVNRFFLILHDDDYDDAVSTTPAYVCFAFIQL